MISKTKRIAIIFFILFAGIGCDQVTKYTAKEYLSTNTIFSYWGDTIRLQFAINHGAFLSFGSNFSDRNRFLIFTVMVVFVLCGLFLYLILNRDLNLFSSIALSLILGGGISNAIDRIIYKGGVVDFLNFGIGSLRTGILNVADMAITAGTLMFLLGAFISQNGSSGSNIPGPKIP